MTGSLLSSMLNDSVSNSLSKEIKICLKAQLETIMLSKGSKKPVKFLTQSSISTTNLDEDVYSSLVKSFTLRVAL